MSDFNHRLIILHLMCTQVGAVTRQPSDTNQMGLSQYYDDLSGYDVARPNCTKMSKTSVDQQL